DDAEKQFGRGEFASHSRTSEWRCLVRPGVPRRRLAALAERVVQEFPALVGDSRRLLHGGAETHELAGEVVECGLEFAPQIPALLGEEEIAGDAADDCAHNRGCHCPRVVHRSSRGGEVTSCMPRETNAVVGARDGRAPRSRQFSLLDGWAM